MFDIFRSYDIRGVYPQQINEDIAYNTGRAYISFLGKKTPIIVVGKDGRNSSPSLFEAVKEGMIHSGAIIIDIGTVTTPLLNFAVRQYNSSAGVMITASHNPGKYNGFKFILKNGLQVHGEDIQKIKRIIKNKKFINGNGGLKKRDPFPDYKSHILSFSKNINKLKMVVDYSNGVASINKTILDEIDINVISLGSKIDGNFPLHSPDTCPENMKKLITTVKKEKANIGVFFDGDGDRSFFIDEEGEIIYPDLLISLLSNNELPLSREKNIYIDLRFSKIATETIINAGGNPELMRVGSPFYKEKLIKKGGLMGAELSGHIMHKDNFFIDDGLFMCIKIMNLMCLKNKKLSEMINPFRKYFSSEDIGIEVKNKKIVLNNLRKYFSKERIQEIDGLSIESNSWWFNIRESNTEDLIRLRIEANTKELLHQKKEEIISLLRRLRS